MKYIQQNLQFIYKSFTRKPQYFDQIKRSLLKKKSEIKASELDVIFSVHKLDEK